MPNHNYKKWMNIALKEANKASKKNEVPVGAILIYQNEIISYGHNYSVSKNDPTLHAEIDVIRKACKKMDNYRLTNTTLVVTLEPCLMCYGAIVQSRISKVVFGAYDAKTGVCGSCANIEKLRCFNHKPDIVGGVLEQDCSLILKKFFQERRN